MSAIVLRYLSFDGENIRAAIGRLSEVADTLIDLDLGMEPYGSLVVATTGDMAGEMPGGVTVTQAYWVDAANWESAHLPRVVGPEALADATDSGAQPMAALAVSHCGNGCNCAA